VVSDLTLLSPRNTHRGSRTLRRCLRPACAVEARGRLARKVAAISGAGPGGAPAHAGGAALTRRAIVVGGARSGPRRHRGRRDAAPERRRRDGPARQGRRRSAAARRDRRGCRAAALHEPRVVAVARAALLQVPLAGTLRPPETRVRSLRRAGRQPGIGRSARRHILRALDAALPACLVRRLGPGGSRETGEHDERHRKDHAPRSGEGAGGRHRCDRGFYPCIPMPANEGPPSIPSAALRARVAARCRSPGTNGPCAGPCSPLARELAIALRCLPSAASSSATTGAHRFRRTRTWRTA